MALGILTDTVTDYNGNVISGATVIIYNTGTVTPATVYSDSAGTIPISGASLTTNLSGVFSCYAATGSYDIKITKTGYNDKTLNGVHVYDTTIPLGSSTSYTIIDEATASEPAAVADNIVVFAWQDLLGTQSIRFKYPNGQVNVIDINIP